MDERKAQADWVDFGTPDRVSPSSGVEKGKFFPRDNSRDIPHLCIDWDLKASGGGKCTYTQVIAKKYH